MKNKLVKLMIWRNEFLEDWNLSDVVVYGHSEMSEMIEEGFE